MSNEFEIGQVVVVGPEPYRTATILDIDGHDLTITEGLCADLEVINCALAKPTKYPDYPVVFGELEHSLECSFCCCKLDNEHDQFVLLEWREGELYISRRLDCCNERRKMTVGEARSIEHVLLSLQVPEKWEEVHVYLREVPDLYRERGGNKAYFKVEIKTKETIGQAR